MEKLQGFAEREREREREREGEKEEETGFAVLPLPQSPPSLQDVIASLVVCVCVCACFCCRSLLYGFMPMFMHACVCM